MESFDLHPKTYRLSLVLITPLTHYKKFRHCYLLVFFIIVGLLRQQVVSKPRYYYAGKYSRNGEQSGVVYDENVHLLKLMAPYDRLDMSYFMLLNTRPCLGLGLLRHCFSLHFWYWVS